MTADFACLERRLIIEVDGEGHSYGDQPRRDAARDALLRREGFLIVRIAAGDVLKDMDAVLRCILATCSDVGPLHHAAARRGPPPRSGEELR
jgi:very-short-patch-repair endonuclease